MVPRILWGFEAETEAVTWRRASRANNIHRQRFRSIRKIGKKIDIMSVSEDHGNGTISAEGDISELGPRLVLSALNSL